MLLLIHPFSSSFFFLSNFQQLNIFVALFSGTVSIECWRLYTWTMGGCIVYTRIRLLLLIYFFIFLSLQFSNIKKNYVALLSGIASHRKLKLGTHNEQWVDVSCIPQSSCCLFIPSPFFFLSNIQRLKFFIKLFSGTVRPRYWKLVTHVDCERMYHV